MKRTNISRMVAAMVMAMVMATSGGAQTNSQAYRPGVTPEGVVYYLPKTAFRITIRMERKTYTPGDFCKYAERYLRMGEVSNVAERTYKIISTDIQPYGAPDKTKMFSVRLNPKTAAPNITLSEEGILLSVNATARQPEEFPAKFKQEQKPPRVNPRQYLSQEVLAAGSTAKMAELTATEIYDIRDSRTALIRGEADFMPTDGEQLRLMLNNLEIQEKALMSLFIGTTEVDTTETIITFCPNKEIDRMILFRLSQKLGIVDKDDLGGAPYYISVTDLKELPEREEMDEKAKKKEEERLANANGLFVNVPGKVLLTLYEGIEEIDSIEARAGQFGYTEMLAGDLFNKKFTTHLVLDPIGGGVEKLDLTQSAK